MTDEPSPDVDPHTQRAAVRDGYDELAETYRRERESQELTTASVVEAFLDDCSVGDRVLDAGCGQGTPVLHQVPDGVEGIGVDLSASMLDIARERADGPLLRGDMTRLPVAADSVDAVTAITSTIHVPVEERPTVYAEFARALCPGGRLLVTAATGDEGWSGANPDWLDSGALMAWSFPGQPETRAQLRDAGFRVTAERTLAETVSDDDDGGSWALLTAVLDEN